VPGGSGIHCRQAKESEGGDMMKPKVAFFDFTGCEGCQLDMLNLDGNEFLGLTHLVDIVNFREIKTIREDDYDIAFIEGSVTRESEIPRLQAIRERAKVVVALGACACLGGMNCLKNERPMEEVLRLVYGESASNYDTIPTLPANAVVNIDHYVRGCPPIVSEFLGLVKALLLDKKPEVPNYPVCVECKMADNVCVFERDMTCIGPVTRAGCGAICITSGRHCWGCRGMVDDPNIESEKSILEKHGLTVEQIIARFNIYNSCTKVQR
jgi:sulfhydrogenase subunit delta